MSTDGVRCAVCKTLQSWQETPRSETMPASMHHTCSFGNRNQHRKPARTSANSDTDLMSEGLRDIQYNEVERVGECCSITGLVEDFSMHISPLKIVNIETAETDIPEKYAAPGVSQPRDRPGSGHARQVVSIWASGSFVERSFVYVVQLNVISFPI